MGLIVIKMKTVSKMAGSHQLLLDMVKTSHEVIASPVVDSMKETISFDPAVLAQLSPANKAIWSKFEKAYNAAEAATPAPKASVKKPSAQRPSPTPSVETPSPASTTSTNGR